MSQIYISIVALLTWKCFKLLINLISKEMAVLTHIIYIQVTNQLPSLSLTRLMQLWTTQIYLRWVSFLVIQLLLVCVTKPKTCGSSLNSVCLGMCFWFEQALLAPNIHVPMSILYCYVGYLLQTLGCWLSGLFPRRTDI